MSIPLRTKQSICDPSSHHSDDDDQSNWTFSSVNGLKIKSNHHRHRRRHHHRQHRVHELSQIDIRSAHGPRATNVSLRLFICIDEGITMARVRCELRLWMVGLRWREVKNGEDGMRKDGQRDLWNGVCSAPTVCCQCVVMCSPVQLRE